MPRSGNNRRSGHGSSNDRRRNDSAAKRGSSDRRERAGHRGQAAPENRPDAVKVSAAEWKAMLRSARRKGEWLEMRLPDSAASASPAALARRLPLPPKAIGSLLGDRGAVKQGRVFKLRLFRPEPLGMPAEWTELNVLYEDDFVLAVNKPAGMEVHPSAAGQRGTLANAVAAYYEATGQTCRVRPVHRIDKDTTGPVLFAKNESSLSALDLAMKQGRIDRRYLALAEGRIADNRGTIDQPIGQDRHHSTRRRISPTGDKAVTHYQVVERFDEYTLVRLELETGRTHQIRVHLAGIGHPLAGDGMYGGHRKVMARQALHGETLHWPHPWTGEPCAAEAPLPDDFAKALNALRRH